MYERRGLRGRPHALLHQEHGRLGRHVYARMHQRELLRRGRDLRDDRRQVDVRANVFADEAVSRRLGVQQRRHLPAKLRDLLGRVPDRHDVQRDHRRVRLDDELPRKVLHHELHVLHRGAVLQR